MEPYIDRQLKQLPKHWALKKLSTISHTSLIKVGYGKNITRLIMALHCRNKARYLFSLYGERIIRYPEIATINFQYSKDYNDYGKWLLKAIIRDCERRLGRYRHTNKITNPPLTCPRQYNWRLTL